MAVGESLRRTMWRLTTQMIISALDVVGWKIGRKTWENNKVQRRKKSKNRFFRNVFFFGGGRESWLVVLVTDIIHYSTLHSLLRWGRLEVCCICQVRLFWSHHDEEWDQNWIHQLERTPGCAQEFVSFFILEGKLCGYKDVPGQSRDDNFQGNNWKLASAVSCQIDHGHFLQLWRVWDISHSYINTYQHQPSTPHLPHPKHQRQRHWDGDGGTLPGYWDEESRVGAMRGAKSRLRLLQGDPMGHEGPSPRPGWWDQGVVCVCVCGLAGLGLAACCWGGWWWMVGWMVGWLVFKLIFLKVGRLMMESFLLDGFDPGWHPFQPWVVSRFDLVTWRK